MKGVRSCHSAVLLFINKLPSEHKRTLLCQSRLNPLLFFLFVLRTALVPRIQLFEQRGLTFSWGQLYSPAVCCHCRTAKEPSQGHMWQAPAVMSIRVSGEECWQFPVCGFGQLRASAVLLLWWFLAAEAHARSLRTVSLCEWATDPDVARPSCLSLGCVHQPCYGSRDVPHEHC